MRLPDKPNLPGKQVCGVVIGEDYTELLRLPLLGRGVETISCPGNAAVDPRLRSHCDLSVLHAFDKRLIVSSHVATETFLSALSRADARIEIVDEPEGNEYPQDASLCAALVGEKAFHRKPFSVLSGDPRLINVKQGYAKCAVCPVTDNAAITSDAGLATAMRKAGIDVLQISPGNIALQGFAAGFIGGSTFKLSPELLAFTGRFDYHPDAGRIYDFLRKHGVNADILTDFPIFDIGSAVIFE
jgi:hypothetical protein